MMNLENSTWKIPALRRLNLMFRTIPKRLLRLFQKNSLSSKKKETDTRKTAFERNNYLNRIVGQVKIDTLKNDRDLPKEILNQLLANGVGQANAEPVPLNREMHEIIKKKMIFAIEENPAPPEDINAALKVSLKFSENHRLEDASDLDIVIRQIQNPPNMIHPASTVLAALIAKKQNSPS